MSITDSFKNILIRGDTDSYNLDDLRIYASDIEGSGEHMEYLLYELEHEISPGCYQHLYKAVKLVKIKRVPKKDLTLGTFLQMQAGICTGYYQAQINYLQIVANVIRPKRLGLIYAYGVQGVSASSMEEAKRLADRQMAALERTITGTFRTLEFMDLTMEDAQWLYSKLGTLKDMRVLRGIPTPKKTEGRGSGASTFFGSPSDQVEDQSEEFLMGMDAYEYILMISASSVPQSVLSHWREQQEKEMTYYKSIESGQRSISAGISMPMVYGANVGASQGWGKSASESWGSSASHSEGTSSSVAEGVSHSQSSGTSHSESSGTSHSVGKSTSHSISQSVSESRSTSTSQSTSQSFSSSDSRSYSQGTSAGQSASRNFGESLGSSAGYNNGVNTSYGSSAGLSHGLSQSQGMNLGTSQGTSSSNSFSTSQGTSSSGSQNVSSGTSSGHNWGTSVSDGTSWGSGGSSSWGSNWGYNEGANQGTSNTQTFGANGGFNVGGVKLGGSYSNANGTSQGTSNGVSLGGSSGGSSSWSSGGSHSVSSNEGWSSGTSHSNGLGVSNGVSNSTSNGISNGISNGVSIGGSVSQGISDSQNVGLSYGSGASFGTSTSSSYGQSYGASTGTSLGASQGLSNGITQGSSTGTTTGVSNGVSHGTSYGTSDGTSISQTEGVSQSVSQGTSTSISDGTSSTTSNGLSASDSTGTTQSHGTGTSSSQGLSTGSSSSMGIGPSISFSKSYAWQDIEVTALLDMLAFSTNRIIQATNNAGMFFCDVYLGCESPKAAEAATALAMSAWHSENTLVCPLQVYSPSLSETAYLQKHLSVFSPSTKLEGIPGRFESYKYTTMLLPSELAAFSHPPRANIGGIVASVDDPPVLSIPGDRQNGEIFLGYVADTEKHDKKRGYKSLFKYTLSGSEIHHCYISGASRSGKTVAALRLVAETYSHVRRGEQQKRMRFLIMDPKQDWRSLAKVVPNDHFRFYSLADPTFHPIRLNLMKIPHGVFTERYADKLREIFIRSFGLAGRSFQLLGAAIRKVYRDAGCFDENVKFNKYDPQTHSYPASERSKNVTLEDVCKLLTQQMNDPDLKSRDQKEAIQRVLDRMESFMEPETSIHTVFCNRGETCMGIDDLLGADDVVVLESYGLDSQTTGFVFGLITSGVFQYGVSNGGFIKAEDQFETVLVIEEANQVLISEDADLLGGANPFEIILDQSAGLGLYIWTLTQKIADMPRSVLANSAIKIIGRQDDELDIKKSIVQIGKDGLIADRVFKNWLPDQPTGWFIIKSSRNRDFVKNAPCHVLIEYLNIQPPSDEELDNILEIGRMERASRKLEQQNSRPDSANTKQPEISISATD